MKLPFQAPDPLGQETDEAARQRIRTSLGESLLVEAAAGTGKTTVLVERLVAILRTGRASVGTVVAVTFTRKAAGELKLRLRQRLDQVRRQCSSEQEARRLEDALARLEEARVGTIHSFCAELLRERPVEALVDPSFEELSEVESPRLYDQAFRRWIQIQLNQLPEGLRRALTRTSLWDSSWDASPLERIRAAGLQLVEWRDFPGRWTRKPFDREAGIDALISPLNELAEMSASCAYATDVLRKALTPVRDLSSWLRRAEAVSARDYDTLEAFFGNLLRDLKRNNRQGRGFFSDEFPRKRVVEARQALQEQLATFLESADADLAARLQTDFAGLLEAYEELKRSTGKLDFVDLLIRARNLVRDNSEARRYFQRRFSHIFVDEFQDTDPLQAEILLLLASDDPARSDWRQVRPVAGKLFLVGDPKQSIYRFRRADVILYRRISRNLAERGVALVHLGRNFRAVAGLQKLVNAAFAPEMTGDDKAGQPEYVPLAPHRPDAPQQPSVVALPVPFPYGWSRVTRRQIELSQPDTTAAFVHWLLEHSGWTVEDPQDPSKRVPLAARHICILFRRFLSWGNDVTREYTSGLEARGVPHLLVGARSFHRREEVETLKAALTAIEWPDDELSVYAALRGTLFAIADNLLLRFKLTHGKLHPFRPLPLDFSPELQPIADGLAVLRDLHRERNRRPIVETLLRLLEETRAHAGFALRPAGNQVLANVQRICDMARSFELSGGLSFRGFVEQLAKEADAGDAEGPLFEEGAQGVRIMTVHAAKGLEFPVVVLADMTAHIARLTADKHVDMDKGLCAMQLLGCSPWDLIDNRESEHGRDVAEGIRIAYVAATRARDLLVVPAVGDEKVDGWLGPLNHSIYPRRDRRRDAEAAPACPAFGEASVIERPQCHDGTPEFSVKPGLHRIDGGVGVVWWDPGVLKLGVEAHFGLRQERILAEDRGGTAAQEGRQRYQEWKRTRDETIAAGAEPSLEVFLASEAATPPDGEAFPIQEVSTRSGEGRPSGRRFGTLVHAVLRDAALEASLREVTRLAELLGRVLGANQEEVAAAAQAVAAALRHPLLEEARVAETVHKELPLLLKTGERRVVDGAVDLLFSAQGRWTAVEFKTGEAGPERKAEFLAQLSWYLKAIGEMTRQEVRGVLFLV